MRRVTDGAWWPRRAALGCTLPLAAALALPLVPLTLDGYLPVAQALWAPSAILAVVAVVVLVVTAVRRHDRLVVACAALLTALVVGIPAALGSSGPAACGPTTHRLTVLAANTFESRASNLPELIERVRPDVVVLPEGERDLVERVQAQLGAHRFAHTLVSTRSWHYAISVLSRHPITGHEMLRDTTMETVGLDLDVDGSPVHLLAAHPFAPIPGQGDQWRDAAASVGRWAQSRPDGVPVVLAGDFNAGWVHPALRSATRGYADATAQWRGLRPTWPSWPAGLGLTSIDHVFTRGTCRTDSGIVDIAGSDHRGVWARLRW